MVPCYHSLNKPASAQQISKTEKSLGRSIPDEYKRFLTLANGGKLFIAPRNRSSGGAPHERYRLFSCEDLTRVNAFLLTTFQEAYADDPELGDGQLNYVAFCDAADDNYQAIVTAAGPRTNSVFLLLSELQSRPYSELDRDLYYTISGSLESWFRIILQTGGWGGRGPQSGGL